jgi:dolichol-phosphate mannosyltransferase
MRAPRFLLILCTLLLFFARLDCPLQEPEETRYAEIPRQMLVEGRFAVPVFHGQTYYDKPPLLYWLVMGSYTLFGVYDWAARLVSSAAAAGCVLATYWWGRAAVGSRAALAGAFMLCLSPRFVQLGRMLTMNGLLALCVVVALAAGHRAMSTGPLRWRWWLVSAVVCALGILTKGPVAVVLIAVPLLLYQLWDETVVRPRIIHWTAYFGAALAVAAPWFVVVAMRDPSFLGYFFWTHHVVRYVAPLDHAQPFWYYLPELVLGMLPWAVLLPGLIRYLFGLRAAWRRPGPLGLFVLASLWCVVFYSASGCKRSGYILPAVPPLALALGCLLDRWLPAQLGVPALWRARDAWAYRATSFALLLGLAASVAAAATGLVPILTGSLWASAAAAALSLFLTAARSRTASWGLCTLATFAVLLIGVLQLLPAYARRYSLREEVAPFTGAARPFAVVCYPHRWDSVNYYLQRGDVRAYAAEQRDRLMADVSHQPLTLAFVKSDRSLADLLRDLPASLEFLPCVQRNAVTVGWIRPRE